VNIWKIVVLIVIGFYLTMLNNLCLAFEIIKPTKGTIFKPGDKVIVELKTESSENLKGVWFYTIEMSESDLDFSSPYNFEFTVPPKFTGIVIIVANGKLQDDTHIESKVQIQVLLPSNITLQGITVDPNPVFLYKMLPNSDPNDVQIFETKNLGVGGMYSDGVERWIASSADGTTYTSSDETIVTVDKEGKVTAQKLGKTKITIRNGSYSATVDVVVKPYK